VIPAPRSTKEHVLRGLRGHEDALRNMSTQLNVSSQLLRSDGLSGSMKSSEASVSAAAAGMTEEAYELFRAMEVSITIAYPQYLVTYCNYSNNMSFRSCGLCRWRFPGCDQRRLRGSSVPRPPL
jgi:hypothetical protein